MGLAEALCHPIAIALGHALPNPTLAANVSIVPNLPVRVLLPVVATQVKNFLDYGEYILKK